MSETRWMMTVVWSLILVACMLVCLPLASAEKSYSFGVVPQFEPRKLFSIWRPVLDELEHRTGFKLKMVGATEIPAFETSAISGEYDFAYMNPFQVMMVSDEQGYEPLIKDSGRHLSGILVVAKDSPIQSPSELAGMYVAFPSPNAFGASILIRRDLQDVFHVQVTPIYVQTHTSVYYNVALGIAAAGGGVYSTLNLQPKKVRDTLRVIYQTKETLPHAVVAHPRVPVEDRIKLSNAFLEIGNDEKFHSMLSAIPMQSPELTNANDYASIKELNLEDFYFANVRIPRASSKDDGDKINR